MTINISTKLGEITTNMTAHQIACGRIEEWKITFDMPIDDIPDEIIETAASSVSWLWMPCIERTGSNSVIYSGYID